MFQKVKSYISYSAVMVLTLREATHDLYHVSI
jgi:hypothetical protein